MRKATDHIKNIVGMHSSKYQVSGQSGLHGNLCGFRIANFTHHDLVGSCRKIERNPLAKVSPFFSFTGIWSIPGN